MRNKHSGGLPPASQSTGQAGAMAASAAVRPSVTAARPVPSGPFAGMDRNAAVEALNLAFHRDMKEFTDAALPATVDLSSCVRQYMALLSEITGGEM